MTLPCKIGNFHIWFMDEPWRPFYTKLKQKSKQVIMGQICMFPLSRVMNHNQIHKDWRCQGQGSGGGELRITPRQSTTPKNLTVPSVSLLTITTWHIIPKGAGEMAQLLSQESRDGFLGATWQLQLSVSSVPADPTPSSDLHGYQTHIRCVQLN